MKVTAWRALVLLFLFGTLLAEDCIMPYFVVDTTDSSFRAPVASMPGQYQLSLDALEDQVRHAYDLGVKAILLFGIPAKKDPLASGAYAKDSIVQRSVRRKRTLCLIFLSAQMSACVNT